jgi:hypothetical protein
VVAETLSGPVEVRRRGGVEPPENAPPRAAPDAVSTPRNRKVTIAVLANDTDPEGGALTVASWTAPAHGTVTAGEAGSLEYGPEKRYEGADGFTYTVCDPQGACATAAVTIAVGPASGM